MKPRRGARGIALGSPHEHSTFSLSAIPDAAAKAPKNSRASTRSFCRREREMPRCTLASRRPSPSGASHLVRIQSAKHSVRRPLHAIRCGGEHTGQPCAQADAAKLGARYTEAFGDVIERCPQGAHGASGDWAARANDVRRRQRRLRRGQAGGPATGRREGNSALARATGIEDCYRGRHLPDHARAPPLSPQLNPRVHRARLREWAPTAQRRGTHD